MKCKKRLNICLVSDFFCPNTGGVETHIYYLGECLLALGHNVIVVTHAYEKRRGIRWLSNGLKVYYLPLLVFYNGAVFPTVLSIVPWFRHIIIREEIDLVHGHSSFSTMAHECLLVAQMLDRGAVFTDHSLFGFADGSSIVTNKLLHYSLINADNVICVSHTSKENEVLRAKLPPERIYVIPNAVDCAKFLPDRDQFINNPLTIVFVGRLVYRKGADLLAEILVRICQQHEDVQFIIAGGDGPKRVVIEQNRERHGLQERVHLVGMVPHTMVRDVLVQGQIFINTSLTEAFCMAIVEAASCGLYVVSTNVGGIPEVLPPELVTLAPPDTNELCRVLNETIDRYNRERITRDLNEIHRRVKEMYYWPDVAARTMCVYEDALNQPRRSWTTKMRRYFKCGFGFGLLFIFVTTIVTLVLRICECWRPESRCVKARHAENLTYDSERKSRNKYNRL